MIWLLLILPLVSSIALIIYTKPEIKFETSNDPALRELPPLPKSHLEILFPTKKHEQHFDYSA